jgi:hypothetical protein
LILPESKSIKSVSFAIKSKSVSYFFNELYFCVLDDLPKGKEGLGNAPNIDLRGTLPSPICNKSSFCCDESCY